METMMNRFTERQNAMLTLLSDGECHIIADMMHRLGYGPDEHATLFNHIKLLRRVLPQGQMIITEANGSGLRGYRWVRKVDESVLAALKNA